MQQPEKGWRTMGAAMWTRARQHDIVDRSAVMAFWFLLGFFPMILGVASLAGRLGSTAGSESTMVRFLDKVLPDHATEMVQSVLGQTVAQQSGHGPRTWLSLGLALWLGSRAVAGVMRTLNVMYGVEENRPWWRQRALAGVLSLGTGVLFAGALAVAIDGPRIMVKLGSGRAMGWVWRTAQWPSAIALLLLALLCLYRFAPNVERQGWERLLPGSLVAGFVWAAGSLLFKLYVQHFSHFGRVYGSLGALIALVLWFFLGGLAILIGGEINATLEFQGKALAKVAA